MSIYSPALYLNFVIIGYFIFGCIGTFNGSYTRIPSMDNKVPLYDASDVIQTDNMRRCCAMCTGLTCTGVYFNKTSQRCLVQRNSMFDPNVKNETGWIYFLRNVPPNYSQSDELSFRLYTYVPPGIHDSAGYAESTCESAVPGGRLLRVLSHFHLTVIWQCVDRYLDVSGADGHIIIMNGRQHSDDHKWYYHNGEPVQYLEWSEGQPNNWGWQTYGNQTVLSLHMDYRDGLHDIQNYYYYPDPLWFFCEE